MATQQNTMPVETEKKRIAVNLDDLDNSTLRINCARAILTSFSLYQRGMTPSEEVLADALFGVDLLLENANDLLIDGSNTAKH